MTINIKCWQMRTYKCCQTETQNFSEVIHRQDPHVHSGASQDQFFAGDHRDDTSRKTLGLQDFDEDRRHMWNINLKEIRIMMERWSRDSPAPVPEPSNDSI